MLDITLQNYTDWRVKPVMKIKKAYGYRVILKYMDGSEKSQQKSGFKSIREANSARERTIAELYNGTYIVHSNVSVQEFLEFWLEEDIKKRVDSQDTYYTFRNAVKNHIVPTLGKKKMVNLTRGDVQKLYNTTTEYSVSVARIVKTVMNISLRYGVSIKVIATNPAEGINLPKQVIKKAYHTRNIDTQRTLTLDQIYKLLEKSKDTPIHMQVLFNVLMGLRRSEIIAVKYSDVDYVNRTLRVERQLGQIINTTKEDFSPNTFTKQERGLKTESSYRVLPIPDYVFEAILEERKVYERNRTRRINDQTNPFYDGDYICCSTYGKPRSKNYHWTHYKKLLSDNNLPDIRWHDLRSTFCTLLLKNDFNSKAVSKLMGHAKEIITMDVYGDNKGILADGVSEIEAYIEEVVPKDEEEILQEELLDVVVDVQEYLSEIE